jgi:hypothetical protein
MRVRTQFRLKMPLQHGRILLMSVVDQDPRGCYQQVAL